MATRLTSNIPQGSTYDIEFGQWSEGISGIASFTFGDLSTKATGLLKASNRFVKVLLTGQGSDPFNPELGTFFEDIQYRGGESVNQLGTFISEQISMALTQIQSIQSENNFPEEESLLSATLTNVEKITSDRIKVEITLTSEAGQETEIVLPVIGG